MSVFVCLCLSKSARDRENFDILSRFSVALWLWLGSFRTALQYAMYFRFVKDVMFASRPVTGDANKASTQSGSTKSSTWTEGVVCGRVYVTVRCPLVSPSHLSTAAAGLLLWAQ